MCADRTCAEVYACLLGLTNSTVGNVLGISPSGALSWTLPGGGGLVAGNLTTGTVGLSVTNGTGAVIGTGTIVNYSLTTGITNLGPGAQGVLGGTGTANTYVGADGQLHLLPTAAGGGSFTAGNLTTTTTGLTIGNGVSAVNGLGSTVNYNLATGIPSLVLGTQGTIGGIGSANTYIGYDGQAHLLPIDPIVQTSSTVGLTAGTTVTIPAGYTKVLYVARNGVIQIPTTDYTIVGTTVTFVTPFGVSGGAAGAESVLVANLKTV